MTVEVSVDEAGANLTRLLSRALAGDDIFIVTDGHRLAQLQPIVREAAARPISRRKLGSAKGLVVAGPDFDAPLPDDVIAEFEK
jgi:antitoxin (DNA-binding transcriptional repressor) of toxin-antitoxin stability system